MNDTWELHITGLPAPRTPTRVEDFDALNLGRQPDQVLSPFSLQQLENVMQGNYSRFNSLNNDI